MPPKKTTPTTGVKKTPAAAKPGVKSTGAAKAPATKAGAAGKGAAGASKGAAAKTPDATAQKTEEVTPAVTKKIMVPEEIGLKEVAGCITLAGDIGQKIKDSNRWVYLIDRNGNVGTFLKYRDTNMISVTTVTDFHNEPMRLALMGALKYGKPCIINISDADQSKILDVVKSKYDEIFAGLYDAIMDKSILDEKVYEKLYNEKLDDAEYKNPLDYRAIDFQFMILTNADPPSTAMEHFIPVIVT